MTLHTRRGVLAVTVGALAGFAGCGGATDLSASTPTPTPAAVRPPDLPRYVLRNPSGEPVLTLDGESLRQTLLTDRAGVESVDFVARPAGTDEAREFLVATDFDRSSVLVRQHDVSACYRTRLVRLGRDDDGTLSVRLCQVVRDASVACETAERHVEVLFVRTPHAGEALSGVAVSSGSNCPPASEGETHG